MESVRVGMKRLIETQFDLKDRQKVAFASLIG